MASAQYRTFVYHTCEDARSNSIASAALKRFSAFWQVCCVNIPAALPDVGLGPVPAPRERKCLVDEGDSSPDARAPLDLPEDWRVVRISKSERLIGCCSPGGRFYRDASSINLRLDRRVPSRRTSDGLRDAEECKAECVSQLVSAAMRERCGASFEMTWQNFLAVFGDAGSHSYGTHTVSDSGIHTAVAEGAKKVDEMLGDWPMATTVGCIRVEHDGKGTARMWTQTAQGQSSLEKSIARAAQNPSGQKAALLAAAVAASHQNPFAVDSDESGAEV